MDMRSDPSPSLPDRVCREVLEACRRATREPPLKALMRRVLMVALARRYRFVGMGEAFRWGKNWRVRKGVLNVGDFVFVGPEAHIVYPTVIGDLTMLAPGVHIVGNDHGTHAVGTPTRFARPVIPSSDLLTVIESDVWIGQRATLRHGITVGRGAVVAAHSMVTRDVPRYAVVAGNPARILRYRFTPEEIARHEQKVYGCTASQSEI